MEPAIGLHGFGLREGGPEGAGGPGRGRGQKGTAGGPVVQEVAGPAGGGRGAQPVVSVFASLPNEKCIWTISQRPSRFSSTPVQRVFSQS